ncbi:MAG: hypothetical protein R3185_09490, partial [Candidatus Thermoplasmatota archaeon]|nr:hypothetical protein [Candidatus Thermoplasmatota archaeon]
MPDQEPLGYIPEELQGRSDVTLEEVNKHGGIKAVCGHLNLDLHPPKEGPAAPDPSTIRFNFEGDIHSHAVMTWHNPAIDRGKHAYTPVFHERNAAKKWERVREFHEIADQVGEKAAIVMSDENREDSDRDAAAIVAIIAATGLRPGSKESLKRGRTGVTTLTDDHVKIKGGSLVEIEFVGKAGKKNTRKISDAALAKYLTEKIETAEERSGFLFTPSRTALKGIMQETGAEGFMLKDFRTVYAAKAAAEALANTPAPPPPLPDDPDEALDTLKKAYFAASEVVADKLNNLPKTARNAYIPPTLVMAWARGMGADETNVVNLLKSHPDDVDQAEKLLQEALKEHIYVSIPGPVEIPGEDDGD